MMDIVIYTTDDILDHTEDGDKEYDYYFWYMSRPPKNFKVGDKVYFATNKLVHGYFTACTFNPAKHETIAWNKNTWVDLKVELFVKPFRGFRYKWW